MGDDDDETVLKRRRPLIINGRKSIDFTSIFDDIDGWRCFESVLWFKRAYESLYVDELVEADDGLRERGFSYAWLVTEQRTAGSCTVIRVIVKRRCSSTGKDCVFFIGNKLLQSVREFDWKYRVELS